MIFIKEFPKDVGATDMMDSARLAGLIKVFNYPAPVDISKYVTEQLVAVRSPVTSHDAIDDREVNPNNVTFDQLIPLIAGLEASAKYFGSYFLCTKIRDRGWRAQNVEADASGTEKPWYNGADIASPVHREYINNLLDGRKNTFWLRIAILFHAYITPISEPHQLICMIATTDVSLFKMWTEHNKKWRDSLRYYWGGWRGMKSFGEHIIKEIEKHVS